MIVRVILWVAGILALIPHLVIGADRGRYHIDLIDSGRIYAAQGKFSSARGSEGDPLSGSQWGLEAIGLQAVRGITAGEGVVVAIIDTGCRMDHPDLAGRFWKNEAEAEGASGVDDDGNGYVDDIYGYDFVSADRAAAAPGEDAFPPDGDPGDFDGHGTHTAGIIAAVRDNGIGIEGVAPEAELMILRAGYRAESGRAELLAEDVIAALEYAIDMGADIVHMGFGGPDSSLHSHIRSAREAGMIIVAAAGNAEPESPVYPAAFDEVIAVTAASEDMQPAVFAAGGSWVSCSAPGVAVLSCGISGYRYQNGTSCASAFVTGCSALIRSINPEWKPEMTEAQIVRTGRAADDNSGSAIPFCAADSALLKEPDIYLERVVESVREVSCSVPGKKRVEIALSVVNGWRELGGASLEVEPAPGSGIAIESPEVLLDRFPTGAKAALTFSAEADGNTFYSDAAQAELLVRTGLEERRFRFRAALEEPELSTGRIYIRDLDGDGDGGADPGEKIELQVELINSGAGGLKLRGAIESEEILHTGEFAGELGAGERAYARFEIVVPAAAPQAQALPIPIKLSGPNVTREVEIPLWISYRMAGESSDMPGGGPGRRGYYPGLEAGAQTLKWRKKLDRNGKGGCRPAVGRDRVFALRAEDREACIYALDAENGEELWKVNAGKELEGVNRSIAFSGSLCLVTAGGAILALDSSLGSAVWSYPPPGENLAVTASAASSAPQIISVAAGGDNLEEGTAASLNPETGRVIWERTIPFMTTVPPVFGDRLVYISGPAGSVCALDIETGDISWQHERSGIAGIPPVVSGQILYTMDSDGTLRALSAGSGSDIFSALLEGVPAAAAVTDNGASIAVLSRVPGQSIITVIDAETGSMIDEFRLAGYIGRTVIGCVNGILSAGECGRLVSITSGKVRPNGPVLPELRNTACSEPAVAGSSIYMLFNGNEDDYICSFGPETPERLPLKCSPNPFNPSTEISFELEKPGRARLTVFDVEGRRIRVIADRVFSAGLHTVSWDGTGKGTGPVSSGLYLCLFEGPAGPRTAKLVMLR